MTGVEYALGALVVVVVLAFVALPLVRGGRAEPSTPALDGPAEERAAIYRELLELELDQKVGKIAEADYRELSDALLTRAAALISDEDSRVTAADDEVEREIAEMRKTLRPTDSSATSEPRP